MDAIFAALGLQLLLTVSIHTAGLMLVLVISPQAVGLLSVFSWPLCQLSVQIVVPSLTPNPTWTHCDMGFPGVPRFWIGIAFRVVRWNVGVRAKIGRYRLFGSTGWFQSISMLRSTGEVPIGAVLNSKNPEVSRRAVTPCSPSTYSPKPSFVM